VTFFLEAISAPSPLPTLLLGELLRLSMSAVFWAPLDTAPYV